MISKYHNNKNKPLKRLLQFAADNFHKLYFFLNPFKPNGTSRSYQLNQSSSILRVVGLYFSFYSHFNRTLNKQTVEALIRCPKMWRLVWVCTVCILLTKRTPGLYGLRNQIRLDISCKSSAKCWQTIHQGSYRQV